VNRDRFAPRAAPPHPPGFQDRAPWISRMPFAMTFRDNPQARCTWDTPPYGYARASLAAIRRRARSSNIRHTNANFRRSRASGFMRDHDSGQANEIANCIC